MSAALDVPPPLAATTLRSDTLLTRRWVHGEVHAYLPAMRGHVITTYYDCNAGLRWHGGHQRANGRARRGVINVIPQGHSGRWDIEGATEVSHVYLSDERLETSTGQRIELLDRAACEDTIAASLLALLSQPDLVDEPGSRLFVEQALDLLCAQLARAHSAQSRGLPPPPRRGLASWQVKRVTEHMLAHLQEEIGLDELATLVQLSRSHFCTAFRLALGCTPHEWLVMQRIARAKQALADPTRNVTEVAFAVGYQTPSAFAASFRKLVGLSPTAYRRAL